MKILVFDLKSSYAHFRKFYTTSSPLTFSFPPRTALQGIVGAILGYSKDEYMEKLKNAQFSLSLIKSIEKIRIPLNFIDTKDAPAIWLGKLRVYNLGLQPKRGHTQIRLEVVKEASYRVYFFHPASEVMTMLARSIKVHKCTYTPYLGIANFIADFHLIGECEASVIKSNGVTVEINSVVRLDEHVGEEFLALEEGKIYFKERMPIQLKKDRTPERYGVYLFEPTGKSIKVKVMEYVKVEDMGNIVWI